MLSEIDASRVYLACGSTDLRKSIDGLAALVSYSVTGHLKRYQKRPFKKMPLSVCFPVLEPGKILLLLVPVRHCFAGPVLPTCGQSGHACAVSKMVRSTLRLSSNVSARSLSCQRSDRSS